MDVFTGRFAFRMLANTRSPKRTVASPIFKKEDGTIYTDKSITFPVNEHKHWRDIVEELINKMKEDKHVNRG